MRGICSFYNIVILVAIATIFIYVIDSSVLNLMMLKGASIKYVTFLVLAWKSSIIILTSFVVEVGDAEALVAVWMNR